MCGRITLTSTDDLVEEFSLIELPPGLIPRFNLAPTQPTPVVTNREPGKLALFRWGLVPSWAKDPSIGSKMINARSESAAEKPAFRDAIVRRRCLVIADGFYEWKKQGKSRLPYFIRRSDRRPFGFAGLWERWRKPDGQWLQSCSILTAAANPFMAPLHDRMPVVVAPQDTERWLHPEPLPAEVTHDILTPRTDSLEGFIMSPVSTLVNSVKNDSPACLQPPAQQSLF